MITLTVPLELPVVLGGAPTLYERLDVGFITVAVPSGFQTFGLQFYSTSTPNSPMIGGTLEINPDTGVATILVTMLSFNAEVLMTQEQISAISGTGIDMQAAFEAMLIFLGLVDGVQSPSPISTSLDPLIIDTVVPEPVIT